MGTRANAERLSWGEEGISIRRGEKSENSQGMGKNSTGGKQVRVCLELAIGWRGRFEHTSNVGGEKENAIMKDEARMKEMKRGSPWYVRANAPRRAGKKGEFRYFWSRKRSERRNRTTGKCGKKSKSLNNKKRTGQ